ncbi:MAG: M48 family metallopeptidase [Firmicutes bacterium]|nr:M48 family metallopeptidase [Bacillota bacterium]
MRAKLIWAVLFMVTAIFLSLYIFSTLQPAQITAGALEYFSEEQIILGRQYSRERQLWYLAGLLVRILALTALAIGPGAVACERYALQATRGHRAGAILLFFLIVWVVLQLLNLPFSYYRSYVLEQRWGFSTQFLSDWLQDYVKSAALDLVFSALGAILFFSLLKRWPETWWAPASLLMVAWIAIQTLLWPTLVAPIYNRFEVVQDSDLKAAVHQLAARAKIPVEEVLVMDASRRTSKANAYFAGLGNTKRIVLYDTLLANFSREEIEAVIAHEMAHWQLGHIRSGVLLGGLAGVTQFYLLAMVLKPLAADVYPGCYPLRVWTVALLFIVLTSFVTTPVQTAISRRMERAADRQAVRLTGNPDGAIALQLNLASRNYSDIMPPQFIEWFAYTHPSTWRRIKLLEMAKQNDTGFLQLDSGQKQP